MMTTSILRRGAAAVSMIGALAGSLRAQGAPTGPVPRGEGVVVELRDEPSSPTVTVVAWSAAQPAFGLRTAVPRSGALLWHDVYLNASSIPAGPESINKAVWGSRVLVLAGSTKDAQNCYADGKCSPPTYFGARVRDNVLRKATEGVKVKLTSNTNETWDLDITQAVYQAYIGVVDSVYAANRKK